MLHSKLLACVLAGSLGLAAAAPVATKAMAEGHGGRWINSPLGRMVTGNLGRMLVLHSELNLSDEQRSQIREVLVGYKVQGAQAAKAVFAKRQALHDAVLADKPDDAAIRKAADDLGKAAGDAAVLAAEVAAKVRPILTTEQQEKIKNCRAECQSATESFLDKMASQ